MEHTPKAVVSAKPLRERIIIALDVPTDNDARAIIDELRSSVGAFKIGLQLFTAAGPSFVREVVESGVKVFLDLKFHDIPNTVASAAIEAARLGVWMFNVHAIGGTEMMRLTVDRVLETALAEGFEVPKIIGVTVLTSADSKTLTETGISNDTAKQVTLLTQLARSSGLDGVVASPNEVSIVRAAAGSGEFMIVTPGIREVYGTNDDQKRVSTLGAALAAGSDYVVVGRAVTQAKDRLGAIDKMIADTDRYWQQT